MKTGSSLKLHDFILMSFVIIHLGNADNMQLQFGSFFVFEMTL